MLLVPYCITQVITPWEKFQIASVGKNLQQFQLILKLMRCYQFKDSHFYFKKYFFSSICMKNIFLYSINNLCAFISKACSNATSLILSIDNFYQVDKSTWTHCTNIDFIKVSLRAYFVTIFIRFYGNQRKLLLCSSDPSNAELSCEWHVAYDSKYQ